MYNWFFISFSRMPFRKLYYIYFTWHFSSVLQSQKRVVWYTKQNFSSCPFCTISKLFIIIDNLNNKHDGFRKMTPGHVWTIDICKTSFHYYIDKVKSFKNSNLYKSLFSDTFMYTTIIIPPNCILCKILIIRSHIS